MFNCVFENFPREQLKDDEDDLEFSPILDGTLASLKVIIQLLVELL